ncbi:aspartate carbamoyltransferase regulatory subunit [Saccharolobus caldissimus]|uniref:Aspartate carbamoyltransferase regulatory chain n=1 Tax=Saccharolobus caldissimus TaxID=1702097 RepID=A0AAQ4CNG6_9CREN|nr:aspartate carbamoyltransferase regulatory subunit [Saccharolobus caldissimus]BDB97347.1 aspartate carbamoyltransferase regulatory subunit [Saccharolobus caldissimus]
MMNSSKQNELIVSKIKDGTVIDHIPAGRALSVLRILGIKGDEGYRIALVMNVESKKIGRKDIVKIEGREIDEKEASLITLIAPSATINIIRNYEVVEKRKIEVPKLIRGLIKCPNPQCITNNDIEALSKFVTISVKPLKLKCVYCETYITEDDVIRQIL